MNPSNKKRLREETSQYDEFFKDVKPALKQTKLTSIIDLVDKKKPSTNTSQQLLTKFISLKKQESLGTGQIPTDSLLICSWNINGLERVIAAKTLQSYFHSRKPDILCLNETKIDPEKLKDGTLMKWVPADYTCYFNFPNIKKRYSGVSIITKYKPMSVLYGMGEEKHDLEGRLITAEFETFYLVACYVPFSGMQFKRLGYRIKEWDPAFREYLTKLKLKKHVVVCGDLNVAHKGIDMWEESGKFIGSSPAERSSFSKLLDAGYVDTFRHVYPEVRKYSWWNIAKGNRTTNKGRRFDYVLVSQGAVGGIKDAFVNNDVHGSDHCPVELLFNPNFEKKKKEETQPNVIVIDGE